MFEEMTFENILSDMLAEAPEGIDTSEGSLLYNACAKQAVRLEEAYLVLAGIEKNMYADTADLEHLIRAGIDRACYIRRATYAEFLAQFNCPVPLGSRFRQDEYHYTVFRESDEENHMYEIGCDEPGSGPNHLLGELQAVEYIEGFSTGKILSCLTPGEDMEEKESFRARLLSTYNYRGFAGNRAYYLARLKELPGVYGCKLERVKTPSDAIRATLIGKDYRTPPEDVLEDVQTAVDPVVNAGEGEGLAPIGHRVTILGVGETPVDIETAITYEEGYTYEGLRSYIEKAVEKYLLDLRMAWETSGVLVVRVLQIEAAIVNIRGIIDVTGTKLNGVEANLQITDGTVPVKGEIVCV